MSIETATLILSALMIFGNVAGAWVNNSRYHTLEREVVRLKTIVEMEARFRGHTLPGDEDKD